MRTYCVLLLVSSGLCLSERELAILGSAARARPNTLINGFHASVVGQLCAVPKYPVPLLTFLHSRTPLSKALLIPDLNDAQFKTAWNINIIARNSWNLLHIWPSRQFEVSEERAGLVTLRTNTRPGYMDPATAGYPRGRDLEFNVSPHSSSILVTEKHQFDCACSIFTGHFGLISLLPS